VLKNVELIAEKINEAVHNGLFNRLWYYIKDYRNYKLWFVLEYDQEEEHINTFLGEFNVDGFKDIYGNQFYLKFENYSERRYSGLPPKYDTDFIYENESFDNLNPGDIFHGFRFRSQIGFALRPHKFHIDESAFSLDIPFEHLPKIEEFILLSFDTDPQLKQLIWDIMGMVESTNPETDFRFDSDFDFVSVYEDGTKDPFLNLFWGFDCEDFYDYIQPMNYEIIQKVSEILNYSAPISNDLIQLPKTILDDLRKIEQEESKGTAPRLIFKEYHRLIERLGNLCFSKYRKEIIQIANSQKDNSNKNKYDFKNILQYDNYSVSSIAKFRKLLYILVDFFPAEFNKEMISEIEMTWIPLLSVYEGYSLLRNQETHEHVIIPNDHLNVGIKALKSIIRHVYKMIVHVK
jgi:hypothetical protein